MSAFVMPVPVFRAFDANGEPLAGGKLYSFEGGTATPLPTYTDSTMNTENDNPVILDASGSAQVWIPDGVSYKFELTDADDNVQDGYPVDIVSIPSPDAPPSPQEIPVGAMMPYGGSSAPTGWLICDGSEISRATYDDLFAVIGTAYGAGDASTTFNIPDCRQRFLLGKAASGTGNVLGATGGAIDHTHDGGAHTHQVTVPRDGWGASIEDPPLQDGRIRVSVIGGSGADATGPFATASQTVASASGGAVATSAANPPFLTVNWIIKAVAGA